MTEVMMNRMSWVEYRDRVQKEDAPVLLPVGATEQHGPHLPLELMANELNGLIAGAIRKELG